MQLVTNFVPVCCSTGRLVGYPGTRGSPIGELVCPRIDRILRVAGRYRFRDITVDVYYMYICILSLHVFKTKFYANKNTNPQRKR